MPVSERRTDIAGIQRFESVLFKVRSNCVLAVRPVFFVAEMRAHGGELWERQAGVRRGLPAGRSFPQHRHETETAEWGCPRTSLEIPRRVEL